MGDEKRDEGPNVSIRESAVVRNGWYAATRLDTGPMKAPRRR